MRRITAGSYLSQSVAADVVMLGEFFDPDKPQASVPARHAPRHVVLGQYRLSRSLHKLYHGIKDFP
jgi:hypothetical protein